MMASVLSPSRTERITSAWPGRSLSRLKTSRSVRFIFVSSRVTLGTRALIIFDSVSARVLGSRMVFFLFSISPFSLILRTHSPRTTALYNPDRSEREETSSMKKLTCCVLSLFFLLTNEAFACTTFCLVGKGEVLFGRNYDWSIGDALLFVNKKGVAKTATIGESANPAKWVSKYGSVTFQSVWARKPDGRDVTAKLADYTRRANRDLIDRSFNGTEFLKELPAQLRFMLAAYPETFTCAAAK